MDRLALGHHVLQDPDEFTQFCQLIKKAGARSYLEIGSWSGGSIEVVAQFLPKGSRIVSVEFPANTIKYAKLKQVLEDLGKRGYATALIPGDSAHPVSILTALELGPYDALFIDGGHTYECVENDWNYYGKLAKIIGFHDIAIDKPPNGVARFWKQLKTKYRHVEFISDETLREDIGYGIGVIFREEPTRGEDDGSS